MRRFYYGPSAGISTDTLSHTQVRSYEEDDLDDSESLRLFSVEAKIRPKPLGLYVRMQDIMMPLAEVDSWEELHRLNDKYRHKGLSSIESLLICQHMRVSKVIRPWVDLNVLPGDQTVNKPEIWSSENRCDICNVDYHVKACVIDSHPTYIVTRCLNLGLGLTMDDPSWKLQTCPDWKTDTEPLNTEGNISPRLCFETTGCPSLED
ncbi:uncharacterized protein N7483_005325 [Penicillium malachiteum]|uniref:uncharacterized protein n=1 Tax=Penicillium malachiteum TaxID=1324776 RepID=UPI002549212E|nr:uncharacterized protein N7483_005325 [Penicillium malachiteum]KAJ5730817.1 hypothetical protein N7483_005325 [Penicillium malachiteum]